MARLRIRIELSRADAGVPLGKMASVVDETQKFLRMLAEDVHIDPARGEWLGSEFDSESLNFTAEFTGSATADQVTAFYAAFDGKTSLKKATISQFARITGSISEDELIGFGLYAAEDSAEPAEWRCLSRRDAIRIADEIQVLLRVSSDEESHLPAVTDAGARLFGKREEDASLAERLTRVERRVEQHSVQIHDLKRQSSAAEDSFRNLLSAVETFCDQAAHQIERVTPAALPAPAISAPPPAAPNRRWMFMTAAAAVGLLILFVAMRLWPVKSGAVEIPNVAAAAPPPVTAAPAGRPSASTPLRKTMRIDLEVSEPTWVALTDLDGNSLLTRLLTPGDPRTVELDRAARLRTGNAGGLTVRVDGKPVGPLGPRGKVREVAFADGGFKMLN